MRKITDIKDSIAGDFMRSEDVAKAYGFNPGDSFTAHFSKASVESVLFYIFAAAAWVLENLFEEHKQEVETRIDAVLPHRPKWYRDKVLGFMKGKVLIEDSDQYDTGEMSEDAITSARIVKHAVATENVDSSILTIKVAGESGGKRSRLDDETEKQLAAYITEIKDAGVRINLVNSVPDVFNCEVDVYFDPMLLPEDVETKCRETIKDHIENLPFNGEYTNMSLVDELQKIEGIRIVELKGATTAANNVSTVTAINARCTPAAGYFAAGEIIINMRVYE